MSIQTRLGRAVILVEDYDKAFAFYQQHFFCHKITGAVTTEGLHVSFSENDRTGIWFLEGKVAGQQTQGQPTLVIYTDNIEDLYTHVQENGVRILGGLVISREWSHFDCADLYGNRLMVVELPGTSF